MNSRRGFLRGIAIGLGTLASLIPALSGRRFATVRSQASPAPTGAPADQSTQSTSELSFQKLGTVADLENDQLLVEEGFAAGPVLLVQVPAAEGSDSEQPSLVAVDPTCPHKQCLVDWDGETQVFVCPCHDSRFDLEGKVTKGPAREPLPVYEAKIEGEDLLVAEPAEG